MIRSQPNLVVAAWKHNAINTDKDSVNSKAYKTLSFHQQTELITHTSANIYTHLCICPVSRPIIHSSGDQKSLQTTLVWLETKTIQKGEMD